MRNRTLSLAWLMTTLGIGGYLAFAIMGDDKSVFLPGETTAGHYQIESSCESCHEPMGGVRQQACVDCHGAELEEADDSHPEKQFTDPSNADRVAKLDARKCVTCHTEHRPEVTEAMGVTLPTDYCFHCHAGVAEDRPTHRGMGFDTCASAGCHNFHDNRALYEDFLVRNSETRAETFAGRFPERAALVSWSGGQKQDVAGDAVVRSLPRPTQMAFDSSAHARTGVSCADCHQQNGGRWSDSLEASVCSSCHELEFVGFTTGKHGMRTGVGMTPMSPAHSRLPMNPESFSKTMGCSSCHDAHAIDVRQAAVESCLSCHADEHSAAYRESPHFRLWMSEASGDGKPGSGVSCASCHLPRESRRVSGSERVVVQHNPNANLRPNEKMIREVCMNCHSLAFSIDALADTELIRRNFSGRPSRHVPSIDMAISRTNKESR